MMGTVIKLKRSPVSGTIPLPANLEFGEVVLNYADDVLYFKKPDNTIGSITNAAGGGSALIQTIAEEKAIMMAIALG